MRQPLGALQSIASNHGATVRVVRDDLSAATYIACVICGERYYADDLACSRKGLTAVCSEVFRFCDRHLHPPPSPPQPLTRAERRRIKVVMKHQRGAWKL